jgi:hypothetical protein
VTEQVSSNFALVGSVPCRLSSELHVDGQWVAYKRGKETGYQVVLTSHTEDANPKRARIVTAEGREVVGP